jgi:hypothetical protein
MQGMHDASWLFSSFFGVCAGKRGIEIDFTRKIIIMCIPACIHLHTALYNEEA